MKKIKGKITRSFLCCLSWISPKWNYSYRYRRIFGRKINLENPKTFNEKILWLELHRYHNDPIVIQCCDKNLVREYVDRCGCGDALVPQIGNWKSEDQIPWKSLPNQFVLKWNFGAGFNIICTDKEKINIENAKKKLNKWKKQKYWLWYGEMHYLHVQKCIVCEKYIPDMGVSTNGSPDDYKLNCFHGKVKYILVCKNRKGMHADYLFFDTDWNLQPFSKYAVENKKIIKLEYPPMLPKAIEYSEKLSKNIPFVRVDWYLTNEKIYFGEMTFTPCGGMDNDLLEGDRIMGELLNVAQ